MSSTLDWVVVWRRAQDGQQHRDRSRSRALALAAACDLIRQQHAVQRIEGPRVVISRPAIERLPRPGTAVTHSPRHWRSYGNDPLPTAAEALNKPLRAFPFWFLRINCDRCGKVSMLSDVNTTGRRRAMP